MEFNWLIIYLQIPTTVWKYKNKMYVNTTPNPNILFHCVFPLFDVTKSKGWQKLRWNQSD